MLTIPRNIGGLIAVAATMAFTSVAHASPIDSNYFVRPFLQLGSGSELIDGLAQNGPTFARKTSGSALQSTVDLGDGTVKSFAQITGPGRFAQAGGSFGERVTFDPDEGANVGFSFAFDGTIISEAAVTTGLSGTIFANFFVHNPSTGATWQNFSSVGGAIIGKTLFSPFSADVGSALNVSIDDMLSDALTLGGSNGYTFDVFASLSVALVTNLNPVTITGDFLGTGTFGIDSDASFTSSSGVFLTGPTVSSVPEPGVLALLGIGLAGLGFARRKRAAA